MAWGGAPAFAGLMDAIVVREGSSVTRTGTPVASSTAAVGEGGWVNLGEPPIIVRAGEAFVAVPQRSNTPVLSSVP